MAHSGRVAKRTVKTTLVRQAAERIEPVMARSYVAMVKTVQNSLDLDDLAKRINHGGGLEYVDLQKRFMEALYGKGVPGHRDSFHDALQSSYAEGANAELKRLNRVPVRKAIESIGLEMRFDLTNPAAVNFIRNYEFSAIQQISASSQATIRRIMMEAAKNGQGPYDTARMIKNVIGLTDKQAKAVENFMRNLSGDSKDIRSALDRKLRDSRYDSTLIDAIDGNAVLTGTQIQDMTDRYYERYLKHRGETIARTESLRAANAGQQEVWNQAKQQGLLDETARKMWLISDDEKTCDACIEVAEDLNPDGVSVDESFDTSEGPLSEPPLHPNCRCTIYLKFIKEEESQDIVEEAA